MRMMRKRKIVSVQVYLTDEVESKVKGRCLGFLTHAQYAKLFENPTLLKKMYSLATVPVVDLGSHGKLDGKRLVVAAKKVNGEALSNNTLFISEPLEVVCEYNPGTEITFSGMSSFITVTESEEV